MILIACSYAETDFDQEPSLIFDISLLRINKPITEWGMEVTWLSYENTVRTLDFISVNETDFERKQVRMIWLESGVMNTRIGISIRADSCAILSVGDI